MQTHYEASTCNDSRRHSAPAPNSFLSTVQIATRTSWSSHHHPAAVLASRPVADAESQHGYLQSAVNRSCNSHVAALTPLKSFPGELDLQPSLSTSLNPTRSVNRSLSARHFEVKRRKPCAIDKSYQRLKTLGKGNFGKVYLAEHRESKLKVAIKMVDKHSVNNNEQMENAFNEKKISETISRFQHDAIAKVYEVIQDDDHIWIIMEFYEGGELFEKVEAQGRLEESEARRWFREIMEGVAFLHRLDVVHRDIKPENILLDRNGHIRICDFGFAKVFRKEELLETYCGSPHYAAPEMVKETPYSGPAVDIWSCGVLLYIMLSGKLPFQSENTPALFKKICTGNYPLSKYICSEAAELISKMLNVESELRPTAERVLQHPWLKQELAECPPSLVQQHSLSQPPASIQSPIHLHRRCASGDGNPIVLQRFRKPPRNVYSPTRRAATIQSHAHQPQARTTLLQPREPLSIPSTPNQLSRSPSFALLPSRALEHKRDSRYQPHRCDSQRGRDQDTKEPQDEKQRQRSTILSQVPIVSSPCDSQYINSNNTRPKKSQISPDLVEAELLATSKKGKSAERKMVDRVKSLIKNPFHKKDE
ncbi:kinase-like domain-containing protein [Endogone sp. FLAS-F59071]|nr:kinase-like domain-containing protein [Endogone sp. FLAS-F59071]|eukprot:RUS18633.1 kinase-like domain-containing protein [Endogone sp. FLAS-F59071]